MPGFTSDGAVLAYSEGCPRQIIRYTPKVYGFQCHFEFTSEAVKDMVDHNHQELTENAHLPYVESAEVLMAHDYQEINLYLYRFLDQ